MQLLLFLLVFVFASPNFYSQGFLKVDGKQIVNQSGDNVLLRGFGLGGWLVPEGYMLQSSNVANSPTEIKNAIIDLIGEANTEDFFNEYRDNFIRREDINLIAEWGFNSIRLPMHFELLTSRDETGVYYESGFETIDSLLSWCEANELYLILDLHCAPGGQSAEPISDYAGYPSLWESEAHKDKTVALWKEIASRYKDEEWIGGYDLINETAWELGDDNAPLRELFIRITDSIRTVDTNHIVFIEGNWFATEFAGLTPPWDENMVYSFHKYWNQTDVGTINYLLNLRSTTNRPLWLGESGENSNEWFASCVELMEDNNIGWAWWTYKKVSSTTGPISTPVSTQYQAVLDYWNGGPKPSETYANLAFQTLAQNLLLENSAIHYDVVDALLRQPYDNSILPFAENIVPGYIYAVNYDYGRLNHAYKDSEYQNIGGSNWNNGWSFRNDGVDIEACVDDVTNGFNVGWIDNGDWMKYTLNVQTAGKYDIVFRYASQSGGSVAKVLINGIQIGSSFSLASTGGWQIWQDHVLENVNLTAGSSELMVQFVLGGSNFNYAKFVLIEPSSVEEELPTDYKVYQNYPNPFNPETNIQVDLPAGTYLTIKVYDILGNLVSVITENEITAGKQNFTWNGNRDSGEKCASGLYLYKVDSEFGAKTRKMILIR